MEPVVVGLMVAIGRAEGLGGQLSCDRQGGRWEPDRFLIQSTPVTCPYLSTVNPLPPYDSWFEPSQQCARSLNLGCYHLLSPPPPSSRQSPPLRPRPQTPLT